MNPRSLLKRAFYFVAPRTSTAIFSASARAFSHRLVKARGLSPLNGKLLSEAGTRVLGGPFQGMILTPMTYDEHIGPFLLGSYEEELHPWWESILRFPYTQSST
jgi:hypothetical protein